MSSSKRAPPKARFTIKGGIADPTNPLADSLCCPNPVWSVGADNPIVTVGFHRRLELHSMIAVSLKPPLQSLCHCFRCSGEVTAYADSLSGLRVCCESSEDPVLELVHHVAPAVPMSAGVRLDGHWLAASEFVNFCQ